MTNKIFGIFAVVAVMAAAGYGVLKNANQNELNDVTLANIEALGQGEIIIGPITACPEGGIGCFASGYVFWGWHN